MLSSFRRNFITFVILVVACILTGCKKTSVVQTWKSSGEKNPETNFVQQESSLPTEAFPWSGTVSHHLLADEMIDKWFAELSARRTVKTFFIISPSHYGLSTQTWSLDDCSWNVGDGKFVHTDKKKEKLLASYLEVPYDPQVFTIEHGISTLIPYIAKYFPNAKVCAVAVEGEPPMNQLNAQKLASSLKQFFTEEGMKDNFLLVSTDFSHHGNLEQTNFKDNRSREFFKAPSSSSWIFCGCDNRPGMYALSQFTSSKTKCTVLYHSNSYELSGFGADDITSYFFSFFY